MQKNRPRPQRRTEAAKLVAVPLRFFTQQANNGANRAEILRARYLDGFPLPGWDVPKRDAFLRLRCQVRFQPMTSSLCGMQKGGYFFSLSHFNFNRSFLLYYKCGEIALLILHFLSDTSFVLNKLRRKAP